MLEITIKSRQFLYLTKWENKPISNETNTDNYIKWEKDRYTIFELIKVDSRNITEHNIIKIIVIVKIGHFIITIKRSVTLQEWQAGN